MDLSNENVIHVEKEGIQYLQFRKLLKYSDIITHGYSLGIEKILEQQGRINKNCQNKKQKKQLKITKT